MDFLKIKSRFACKLRNLYGTALRGNGKLLNNEREILILINKINLILIYHCKNLYHVYTCNLEYVDHGDVIAACVLSQYFATVTDFQTSIL